MEKIMKYTQTFESFVNKNTMPNIDESKISDIHIMAGESDSFTAFRKAFMEEYGKPTSVKELKQLEAWLQTIWNERGTNEAISMDAVYIHQITGSGQDSAQNFIDDNNIDSEKLVAYLKQHKDSKEKYDVRDMIKGTNKNKRFMKQFLNEAMQAQDFFKDPMHLADAKGWVRNLKLSDDEIKAKIKAVMKNPSQFNDLMDAMTDELNLKWK